MSRGVDEGLVLTKGYHVAEEPEEAVKRVRTGFQKTLDSHGYGFQYAVQRKLDELATEWPVAWRFEAAEMPVKVRNRETRIDFVYRGPGTRGYLVGECKRVRAGVDWCFIRGGGTPRRHDPRSLVVEAVLRAQTDQVYAVAAHVGQTAKYADIGREFSTSAELGDARGPGKSSIEDAVTQVLAGASGLAAVVAKYKDQLAFNHHVPVLPVVFTTARLWYSDAELSSADLASGRIRLDDAGFGEVPWIPLQYHQSVSLVSEVRRELALQGVADELDHLHRRTVFIVNAGGIAEFLQWTLTDHR